MQSFGPSALLRRRWLSCLAAGSIALGAMMPGGCARGGKRAARALPPPATQVAVPRPEQTWVEQPIAVPPTPVLPVVQGAPAPLVYLVESAAIVRVADLTGNQDLLRMPVPARTLVAVDARAGIRVGGATMKLGPLPADHTYGIYLESNTTNVIRRGTIRPGRPGQVAAPSTRAAP